MCDETTFDRFRDRQALTRRELGAISLGVSVALLAPRAANALDVAASDVDVPTPDGVADCHFVHPTQGTHAGVLIWPDARGLRAVYRQMARRLAESGYAVLVVNPYYRGQRAPVLPEGASQTGPETMSVLRPLLATMSPDTHVRDSIALIEYLDAQPAVDVGRGIGVMGYCLGGPITMRAAAAVPERVGACASFHGIQLATDGPDSPHLLVPRMRSPYVFAIAEDDDARDPAVKTLLRKAFDGAGLPADIEVYEGTMHSWCTADSPVHDPVQAERAWQRMRTLFDAALA
jgi:carboxymethylenebutenolidase